MSKVSKILLLILCLLASSGFALEPIAPSGEIWKPVTPQKLPAANANPVPAAAIPSAEMIDLPYKPQMESENSDSTTVQPSTEFVTPTTVANTDSIPSTTDLLPDDSKIDWSRVPSLPLKLIKLDPAPDPSFK